MKTKGKEIFLEYYKYSLSSLIFDEFLLALELKTRPVLLFNPELEEQLRFLWGKSGLSWQRVEWFPHALYWPPEVPFGETLPGYEEKLIYPMNVSSLLPVVALAPKPDEVILDACAAPGGKTLGILFSRGRSRPDTTGGLVSNDVSSGRRLRLRRMLDEYGVDDVEVWGRPAETLYQQYPEHFDKILLDAPCSSEKHVWNDAKYLKEWTPNRVKVLHKRQLALLGGLVLALKPGGRLVYSTCAVNTLENEGTVGEFLRKKGDMVELTNWTKPIATSQQFHDRDFGFEQDKVLRVLPHEGFDPMFVAVFRRKK